MFERFSESAIKVIMLAQEEARKLGHNHVGTEQILLGIIGLGRGAASTTLRNLKVDIKRARREVENIIGRGSGFVAVEIPFTPRAKRALEWSVKEANAMGDEVISPEHLLFALLRVEDSVAVKTLQKMDVNADKLVAYVQAAIGSGRTESPYSGNFVRALELVHRDADFLAAALESALHMESQLSFEISKFKTESKPPIPIEPIVKNKISDLIESLREADKRIDQDAASVRAKIASAITMLQDLENETGAN